MMPSRQHSSQAARRRANRRKYLLRRVAALGVVFVVGYGLVSLVGIAIGGDGPSRARAVPPSTLLVVTNGSNPITAPPTTSTTSPPREPTVPTAENPARLLIAGDSDAGSFGPYLRTLMDQTGLVATELDYKTSSGLARPDFFDWPAHFNTVVPEVQPDIVVVTFGGNDAQGLSIADGTFIVNQPTGEGDEEWRTEYGRRVGATMDQLSAGGRTLIWVGIPNDDNPDVTARMQVQDEVVKAEAAKRPHVVMIDTWKRFSGRNGGWAEYVIDPRDGVGKDVRADDGFHLNQTGAEILALDIAEAIRADLRARGAKL